MKTNKPATMSNEELIRKYNNCKNPITKGHFKHHMKKRGLVAG